MAKFLALLMFLNCFAHAGQIGTTPTANRPILYSTQLQRVFYASFFATDFNLQSLTQSILRTETDFGRTEFRERLLKKNLMARLQNTNQNQDDLARLLTTISDYYQELVIKDLQNLQAFGSAQDVALFKSELADFERALSAKITDLHKQNEKNGIKSRAGFIAVMFVVALAGAALMAAGGIGVLIGISFTLVGGMSSLGELVSWLSEEADSKKSQFQKLKMPQQSSLYERLSERLKNIGSLVQKQMP